MYLWVGEEGGEGAGEGGGGLERAGTVNIYMRIYMSIVHVWYINSYTITSNVAVYAPAEWANPVSSLVKNMYSVVVSFHSVEFIILPTRNRTFTPSTSAALAEQFRMFDNIS
jgi:hypothetical protein